MQNAESQFVSRGGDKLAAALRAFNLSVKELVCADFGSHTGGFVDCLLQNGAARVYAVDPGYGILDYRLRRDPRVVLCERTNALQYTPPELCGLITIDVGWTPQRLILPAARRGLAEGGRVVTLVKPHYEAPAEWLRGGVLPQDRLAEVRAAVLKDVAEQGWRCLAEVESPLRGHAGNSEFLWLLTR